MMKRAYAVWLLAGMTLLGGATAHAADVPERELGLLLGGGWADKDLVGGKDGDVNPLIGLRYGQRLNDNFNFFGDLVFGGYDGDRAGVRDADVTTLRGGIEWLFSKQQKFNWFLSGGLGAMYVNTDKGPEFTRPMASLGVGQAWPVGANNAFRWEVRADQSFGISPNADLTNFQALLGYSWGLGAPLDSDGDGVANRQDQCPNTPKGAKVDAKGCPLDSDGDGVFDGLDKCPGTPAGVKVNADGCPPPVVVKPAEPVAVKQAELVAAKPMVVKPAEPMVVTLDAAEGVNFDSDSAKLRPESSARLKKAAATLKSWGEVKVEVAGHTDSTNTDAYNLKLSQRRAEAVRAHLIKKGGVAAERLTAKGYGESSPVADNKTKEGRFKNRRVELIPQQ